MTARVGRWLIGAAVAVSLSLLGGCVAPGYGGGGVGYDVGFYETDGYYPEGYDYGGWGGGYRVGPGGRGRDRPGNAGHAPAYRPAPRSRPMPSIPSHSRGGGGSQRH